MSKAPPDILIFLLANQAFLEADALAEHIIEAGTTSRQPLFTAAVTGIVTSYCRPFMGSNGLKGLPSDMTEFPAKELGDTHATVFELRHKFAAHFDRKHSAKFYRNATPAPTVCEIQLRIGENGFEVISSAPTLTRECVLRVRKLCDFQKQRVSDYLEKLVNKIRDSGESEGTFIYRGE